MSSSTSSKLSADDPRATPTKDTASGTDPSEAKQTTGMTGGKDAPASKKDEESGSAAANQNNTTKQQSAPLEQAPGQDDTAVAGSQERDAPKQPDNTPEEGRLGAAQADADANTARDTDDRAGADTGAEADEADEEEETLDLRALFASSEPDFAEPTDTFEAAKSAKAEPRPDATNGAPDTREPGIASDPSDEDTASPFDLPDEAAVGRSEAEHDHGGSGISAVSDITHLRENTADADRPVTPGDPLADAVQSALRSVYGDAERDEDGEDFQEPDTGTNASGPVLQWASAVSQEAGEDHDRTDRGEDAPTYGSAGDSQIDEETTEAVLSYLYEHVGRDHNDRAAGQASEIAHSPQQADPDDFADADTSRGHEGWPSDAASGLRAQTSGPLTAGPGAPPATVSDQASSLAGGHAASEAHAFQQETFHAPVDLGMDSSEASGKLLGAAGLGLIGGIAATGVVAVFVFNSFVTKQDPASVPARTMTELGDSASPEDAQTEMDSARRAEDPAQDAAATRLATGEDTPAGAATLSGSAVSDPQAQQAAPPRTDTFNAEAVTPTGDAAAKLEIEASSVAGRSDKPIPLALSVPQSDRERFVRIDGLPEGVKLSAGVDTGNGSWLLSADRANDLALTSPESFSGAFALEAEVLGADARTPVSDNVRFEVSVEDAASTAEQSARTAALEPNAAPAVVNQPSALIARARSLLKAGDVSAAREMLRVQAENGNASAALALGVSYDPITFSELTSPNASPDATAAFRWYMKAAELGEPAGRAKMSELKSWLLR